MVAVAKFDSLAHRLERERQARLEAEALLEEKSLELYRSNLQLTRLNGDKEKHLRILNKFALAITQVETEEALAWYVAREVVGKLGFSDCVFYITDRQAQTIVQRAAIAEKNPSGDEILNPLVIPIGAGVTGTVAKTGLAEIVEDVTQDQRYVPDVAPGGSEIAVPLIQDGEVLGVIDCEDPRKGFFTRKHLEILQTVASYAAAKIAERRAHTVAANRANDLEDKVAELIRLKNELEIAKEKAEETSALKSRFVATISHEIRTPLAGILGSLDLLEDEDLGGKASALVHMARTSGQSLQTLLNDVIDFARSEAGTLQLEPMVFSISELVSSIQAFWQPHLQAKNCSLGINIADDVHKHYWGDPARIRQILNNYLSNALKYAASDRICLSIRARGSNLEFSVTDFGPGLSDHDQKQLFSEFVRVGANRRRIGDGAGLGLAICKQIAELMKGSVGVNSKESEGATFWLCAPLEAAAARQPQKPKKTTTPQNLATVAGRRPKVLVAEDVPTNQMLIRMSLEGMGCRVTIANNGVEAVDAARKQPFDVIFMDIAMPEMDGTAATARIRELLGPQNAPPIYALTAHGMDEDREEFVRAGMCGIVTKPFDRQDLFEAVRKSVASETKERSMANDQVSATDFDDYPDYDPNVLEALLGSLDDESRLMLLGQCVTDLVDCLTSIQQGLEGGNTGQAVAGAHRLKSVGGTFGLTRLQHIAGNANDSWLKGDQEQSLMLCKMIEQQLPAGITTLRKLTGSFPQTGENS